VWEGRDSAGRDIRVTFRVVSGGSAVLSEITDRDDKEDMITVFHLDGDRLLTTHYCGAENQPRMRATATLDAKQITFELLDVTNLKSERDGHMRRVVLRLVDDRHHTEEWTFVENGKETTDTFVMQRAPV
jgi:hypothetical protein